MNPGAGVHSLEALEDWFAALSQFRTDAQNALASLAISLQRSFDWLADQQQQWRREIRAAEDIVVQARNDLRTKKYQEWMGHQPDTTVEEKQLRKALERLHYAEDQLEITRRWTQRLPGVIQDNYDGPVRNFGFFLDSDMKRAMALLARQLGILEQYLNLDPQTVAPPPAAPSTVGARSPDRAPAENNKKKDQP